MYKWKNVDRSLGQSRVRLPHALSMLPLAPFTRITRVLCARLPPRYRKCGGGPRARPRQAPGAPLERDQHGRTKIDGSEIGAPPGQTSPGRTAALLCIHGETRCGRNTFSGQCLILPPGQKPKVGKDGRERVAPFSAQQRARQSGEPDEAHACSTRRHCNLRLVGVYLFVLPPSPHPVGGEGRRGAGGIAGALAPLRPEARTGVSSLTTRGEATTRLLGPE